VSTLNFEGFILRLDWVFWTCYREDT